MSLLLDLFLVSRAAMAPFTMTVPVLGVLSLGTPVSHQELFWLMGLGLTAHLFGFTLNDIIDYRLDCRVPTRGYSPLVKQRITLKTAWYFALLQIPLALLVYYVGLKGSLTGMSVLMLGWGLSVVYNLWSKWGQVPRFLAELALALSIGLLSLAGALCRRPNPPLGTFAFTSTLTLVTLLLNSVPNGLKNLKTDFAYDARSFVMEQGCRMVNHDCIFVSGKLRIYSLSLQTLIVLCLIGLTLLFAPHWITILLISWLTAFSYTELYLLLNQQSFLALRRQKPFLFSYANYFALSLFLFARLPLYLQIAYLLPIAALLLLSIQKIFQYSLGLLNSK